MANNKYSSNQVLFSYANRTAPFDPYAPRSNYIERTSILPSKPNASSFRSSRGMSPVRSRPVRNPSSGTHSSLYNPRKYSSSPHNNNDLIRPSTRAAKPSSVSDRYGHGSSSSYSSYISGADSYAQKNPARSIVKSRPVHESSHTYAYGSSSASRRRSSGSLESPVLSSMGSGALSRSYTSGSANVKKEAITVEKPPYTYHYEPSFARSDSPKRVQENVHLYTDSPKRSSGSISESTGSTRRADDINPTSAATESYKRSGYRTPHIMSHHSRYGKAVGPSSPHPRPSLDNRRSSRYITRQQQSYDYEIGRGTTGLRNIGNTCFMNSILQCLFNTEPLRKYCLESRYIADLNKEKSTMKGKLMTAFVDLMKELWKPNAISFSPNQFKAQIQKFSPRFMGYEQQDSQEFLRFLLEGLHEDINKVQIKSKDPLPSLKGKSPREKAKATWKWYATKDKSFVFDLFVGQLESSLKCTECNHVSLTYDPFWDLSLPISKTAYSGESTSIRDCLKTFTKEETLDRDEKPTCENCKTRRRMIKKMVIHKFPKILVLHLKRFHEGSRYRQKLTNKVDFPLKSLHLDSFASAECENRSSCIYDLYAVSNHCGSCYGGHYTAYCYNTEVNEWYEYSDTQVSAISSNSVCTKEAYVLFYTQRDIPARL